MRNDARRQLEVAAGTPIEWDVAEPEAVQAIKTLLRRNRIRGIIVRHVPPRP